MLRWEKKNIRIFVLEELETNVLYMNRNATAGGVSLGLVRHIVLLKKNDSLQNVQRGSRQRDDSRLRESGRVEVRNSSAAFSPYCLPRDVG